MFDHEQYSRSYEEDWWSSYLASALLSAGNLYTPLELTVEDVSEPKTMFEAVFHKLLRNGVHDS